LDGRNPLATRCIAFITDGQTVHDILIRLGEPTTPPRIAPARVPWNIGFLE
jgi:hypothetical protein